MSWLLNFVVFQVGWFACVLGGAYRWPWLGTGAAGVLILMHLWRAPRPGAELMLVLLAGLLGTGLDSWLVALGLLTYPSGVLFEGMAPHWIVAMWMLFATTLNVTFRWLKGRWVLAAMLGAVAGPLAYYGGARLGGVTFIDSAALGLAGVALNWALAMPVLIALSDRFDGLAETGRRSGSYNGSDKAEIPE